jgi:hypothetical protein
MADLLASISTFLSDRYRIERELGAGGMATVYLAHDLKHDREVALKVLRPELGAVLGPERFLAEIRITARRDHPHILTLIDSGVADGFLFYVLPFARGESLRDPLNREKQLGIEEALPIAKLLTEQPTRIRIVRNTVPEGVDSAVAKALAKIPALVDVRTGAERSALDLPDSIVTAVTPLPDGWAWIPKDRDRVIVEQDGQRHEIAKPAWFGMLTDVDASPDRLKADLEAAGAPWIPGP